MSYGRLNLKYFHGLFWNLETKIEERVGNIFDLLCKYKPTWLICRIKIGASAYIYIVGHALLPLTWFTHSPTWSLILPQAFTYTSCVLWSNFFFYDLLCWLIKGGHLPAYNGNYVSLSSLANKEPTMFIHILYYTCTYYIYHIRSYHSSF